MTKRAARWVAVLLLAPILAACAQQPDASPDGGSRASHEERPGEGGQDVTLPVTVTLADAGAVTATVSPADGGVLEAVGPEGTAYRLEVPPGAVDAPVPITMTPLAGVSGEHVDGLIGGVDLAPDGLELAVAARLTIVPAREVAADAQVPFTYEGAGTAVMLGLVDPDPAGLVVWVEHFSGSGVLESTDARVEMNRRLAAAEAKRASTYTQRVAAILLDARINGAGTLSAAQLAAIEEIRQEMIRDHLTPRVEYAERLSTSGNPGDLGYIADVIAEMLALERQAQLLGTSTEVPQAIWDAISRITANVLAAMSARCEEENDFTVAPLLAGLQRQTQLLGVGEEDWLSACLSFELHLTAEIEIQGPWPHIAGAAEAVVPVDLAGGEQTSGPLQWRWSPRDAACAVSGRSEPGTLTVGSAGFWWGGSGRATLREDGRLAPPDDLLVLYEIGTDVTEIAWEDCDQTHGFWVGDHVRDAWSLLHDEDRTDPWWAARDWEMLFDGPLVARKVYEQRREDLEICFEEVGICWPFGVPAIERTTLELVHAP